MHLIPMTPPAHVQMLSGFDYVTVDAANHRIYAAHSGSRALLIATTDGGAILGQVQVGPMHGVAVDPSTGHVFTGNGEARTVSEVDPTSMSVVRSADVDGIVDAIAYDPALHRVYADEDDGTHVFVVDTMSMKQIASIAVPGHKPEYLAVDPETHDVYQNIDNLAEVAVIDAQQMKVARTIATPEIQHNHPLLYDAVFHILVIGGKNGTIASFSRDGKMLASATAPAAFDQCDLDSATHMLACAGSKKIVVYQLASSGSLVQVADLDVPAGVHTLAFDSSTGHIWIVWSEPGGDFLEQVRMAP